MKSNVINAILNKEAVIGNFLTKKDLRRHLAKLEKIRLEQVSITEKKPAHDPHKHGVQITRYARAVARDFGCSQEEVELIALAAKFHDVGKIEIVDKILNKPGKLTAREYAQVKEHAFFGQQLLFPLTYIARLIRHHHERYDGGGYPDGLIGRQIPLGSRIIAVIDAFNAMTHQRTYNKPISRIKAIEELKRNVGSQFDPDVIRSFISVLNTAWLKRKIEFIG